MKGGADATPKAGGVVDSIVTTLSNKHVILLLALGTLVAIIVLTVLIARRVLKSSLTMEHVFRDAVAGGGAQVTVPASKIPGCTNGDEFAYSFWVYAEPGPGTVNDRFVLDHGAGPNKVLVVLDKDKNALTVQLGGEGESSATLPYLPMNRWVHVVAVYNSGSVTFFEDGEVHSVHGLAQSSFAPPSGDMHIGGDAGQGSDGFSGYVGYVSVMNFQPSPGLVKRLYAMGPMPRRGWLSVFGIPGYGVRNPVYRLNTVATDDKH